MEKTRVTPKDFFLWAGAMIALFWSVISFIFLMFNYINYAFPNPLSYPTDPYQSGMPYEMASIVVLFPIFLLLMWIIRRDIARDHSRRNVWIRRWALIFTLFIAGLAMIIDLVTVLSTFFRGDELTEAFILKVLIVLFVAAIAFMHFIADLWDYWQKFPKRDYAVICGVSLLAILSVASGFLIIGTPQQARAYQFDDQRITDLQSIQSEVVSYWQQKQTLPAQLAALNDSISGYAVPVDPQTGAQYGYTLVSSTTFKLCANFNATTQPDSPTVTEPAPIAEGENTQNIDWYHTAGEDCFVRTIDPSTYPPTSRANQ